MANHVYNVLFLCTGNSARSIMAECLINRWGEGKFKGFSAGSDPKGTIHPLTIELLKAFGYDTDGLRSKSWDEFAEPGGPRLDFIFTVCDHAAGEPCPLWPGQPITAHWGLPDPAATVGTNDEKRRCFRLSYRELEDRIRAFTSLPIGNLDHDELQRRVEEIGRLTAAGVSQP